MDRYRASIKISAGHALGSRPNDWTDVIIEHTFIADSRAAVHAAIEAYARALGPGVSDLIDHPDTRVSIDDSLISST